MKSQPCICVPIQVRTQKQTISFLRQLKGKADMAELWLDDIRDLDLPELLRRKPVPVICRGKRALEAGRLGADCIDIPFTKKRLLRTKAKLILSHHDFKKTPSSSNMLRLALAMRRAGASIVKISVMARSSADTMEIIFLAQELHRRKIPHLLIAMGEKGKLSRILTPHLGGTFMFAPLKHSQATAPGQLTVQELRAAWRLMK